MIFALLVLGYYAVTVFGSGFDILASVALTQASEQPPFLPLNFFLTQEQTVLLSLVQHNTFLVESELDEFRHRYLRFPRKLLTFLAFFAAKYDIALIVRRVRRHFPIHRLHQQHLFASSRR